MTVFGFYCNIYITAERHGHGARVAEKEIKKSKKMLDNRWTVRYNNQGFAAQEKATQIHGEMSEWFKELVLKTSDSERGRGFESHSLRQLNIT